MRPGALVLIVSLIVSEIPGFASGDPALPRGAIAWSIHREAERFAAESAADLAQSASQGLSDWRRVQRLHAGQEIVIATRTSTATRLVLTVDDAGMTVADLTALSLNPAVLRVVRGVASNHPTYFSEAQKGNTFLLDPNVELSRDGVLVHGQRIATLDEVFGAIPRADVASVVLPMQTVSSIPATVAGVVGGSFLGWQIFASQFDARCGNSCGEKLAVMFGSLFGLPVLGGVLSARPSTESADD